MDNRNIKYVVSYEGISEESLAELSAMLLCSCCVYIDPWKICKTVVPKDYEFNDVKDKFMSLAEETRGGLSKLGRSLTLFYTRKSFVLFLVNQLGLLSKETKCIPDFIKFGNETVKLRFISGLSTHLYIEKETEGRKAIYVDSCGLAQDFSSFFNDMSFKTNILFRKADGKRIKNDRYTVFFYKE